MPAERNRSAIIQQVTMMGFFSRLFASNKKPTADAPQTSKRPAWVTAIPVASRPIQLCSALPPETLFRESPRQEQPAVAQLAATGISTERLIQPDAGADSAVPWPMPVPAGAQLLTFWGEGSAHTGEFSLPSDAAMRIVVSGGLIRLSVKQKDGSFLNDKAQVNGLGLMAIAESGVYSLVVEATAEVNWGVTVLFRAPAAGA